MNSISSAWSRTHHNIILKPVCGYCNHTLDQHDLPMWERPGEYGFECYVTDDLGNFVERNSRNDNLDPIVGLDYYVVADSTNVHAATFDHYALPYFDHSGNPSDPRLSPDYNRDLEYDYEGHDNIWEAIDNWVDKDPLIHTTVLGEEPNEFTQYIEPELRNAYVEGNPAFLSREVLDLDLTIKYQAKLLNWFLDSNPKSPTYGEVRVGGMRFYINENGERIAQCVRACCKDANGNWYKPGTRIDDHSHSVEAMQDFIITVIQHGNNCAAGFIRNRADWYAIGTPKPRRFEGDVAFVMDHQQYCKDARCKCSEWLDSEVPALSATA